MSRDHPLTDSLRLSDRERLLTVVAMFGCRAFSRHHGDPVQHGWEWREENLRPGDVVQCQTQIVPHRWCVAWLEAIERDARGDKVYLLREFGGEALCRVHNERLYALRGVPPQYLFEGLQWRAYVKLQKALDRLDDYHVRPEGLTFPDRHSREGTIAVRPHIFSMPTGMVARPIEVSVRFTSRTRIRDLVRVIEEATPAGCWDDRWEPDTREAS